jgi:hypothetical protein
MLDSNSLYYRLYYTWKRAIPMEPVTEPTSEAYVL